MIILRRLAAALWAAGVVAAAQSDTVAEYNVRIPMRDGVSLSADIYRPAGSDRVPVVLVRNPYTKAHYTGTATYVPYPEQGRWWAEQGYAFVLQDVRGRGDSDGIFYPLVNEAADGFDTLDWIGQQSWSNGRVGMIGGSYLGWTQVYAAGTRSPYLKAIIPAVTPPDPDRNWPRNFGVMYFGGLGWLISTDGRTRQEWPREQFNEVLRGLPLSALGTRMGRNVPIWQDWISHPAGDSYWRAQSYQDKLAESGVPALHVGGWYDYTSVGITENFVNASESAPVAQSRQQQRLLIGPWQHDINRTRQLGTIDFGPEALIDLRAVQKRWFDHWLQGLGNGVDKEPRVRIFAMGANRWMDENEWPIARTKYVKYYLRSGGRANTGAGDGRLSPSKPRAEPPDRFRYDPSDPTPYLKLFKEVDGPDDYRSVEERADVLVYTGETATKPTLVCGPVRVKLFASTSARDTDWGARILDVHPDGFAQRLRDGIIRARFRQQGEKEVLLEPGSIYEYNIDLWATCLELQKGHRLRLEIFSSMFPRFDRNTNTGGRLDTETRSVVAEQTVLHDRDSASYLLLPIVPPVSP